MNDEFKSLSDDIEALSEELDRIIVKSKDLTSDVLDIYDRLRPLHDRLKTQASPEIAEIQMRFIALVRRLINEGFQVKDPEAT